MTEAATEFATATPPRPVLCQYCKKPNKIRIKGLCYSCYKKPEGRQSIPRPTPSWDQKNERANVPPCKECGRRLPKKVRGLCGTCYSRKEVRDKYPTLTHRRSVEELALEPRCRHCSINMISRARGLCWRCYTTIPNIKELYPVTSKFAVKGIGRGGARLPETPTTALPGTEAKVQVLEERARRGLALWHPQDAGGDPLLPFLSLLRTGS